MPFKAYEEINAPPIELPVGGKTYTLQPIGAKLGILLISSVNGDAHAVATLGSGTSLWANILGPVYDEMVADDVPIDVIARAGFTALADFQYDRETAEGVWESGLNPEARAALAAAIQTSTTGSPLSPSTAAGSKTRPRASTSGTSSRKAPSRSKASRSAGKRSSASGR